MGKLGQLRLNGSLVLTPLCGMKSSLKRKAAYVLRVVSIAEIGVYILIMIIEPGVVGGCCAIFAT
jgi:hypothetical protein